MTCGSVKIWDYKQLFHLIQEPFWWHETSKNPILSFLNCCINAPWGSTSFMDHYVPTFSLLGPPLILSSFSSRMLEAIMHAKSQNNNKPTIGYLSPVIIRHALRASFSPFPPPCAFLTAFWHKRHVMCAAFSFYFVCIHPSSEWCDLSVTLWRWYFVWCLEQCCKAMTAMLPLCLCVLPHSI